MPRQRIARSRVDCRGPAVSSLREGAQSSVITFRPLAESDLDLVHRWMNAPHARAFFGRSRAEIEEVHGAAIRGEETFRSFVALRDGEPFGLFDWGFFDDDPEMQRLYGVDDPDAANCDVLIGEHAHEGLGALAIRAFLDRVVFADPRTSRVVIDPVPENAIAIRAYEKAGFRFVRACPDDGEGSALYLMELTREAHHRGVPDEAIAIVPARDVDTAIAIDDDASRAYLDVGIELDPPEHFGRYEAERWRASLARGDLLVARVAARAIGFASIGRMDGRPFLDQLSVVRDAQRGGAGRALLLRAMRRSVRDGELWLDTYAHVPWNAPWYARMGFELVPDGALGPELRAHLARNRAVLPAPDRIVAMVCRGERFAEHMRRAAEPAPRSGGP